MPSHSDKDQGNVARGLKAAIHNDNVSEEAKVKAAQRLEEMGSEVPADFSSSHTETPDLQPNQTRGNKSARSRGDESAEFLEDDLEADSEYKPPMKNSYVSEKAKELAEEVLLEAYE